MFIFVTSLILDYTSCDLSASTFYYFLYFFAEKRQCYTRHMEAILRSIFPKEFFTHSAHFQGLLIGVLYLVSLIAQLFRFEKFSEVTAAYQLPGGDFTAAIVAWLLPLTALVALPFLLSMRLNRRARVISRTAVIALPLFWLVLGIWLSFVTHTVTNSGFLGATMALPSGFWLILLAALWLWVAVSIVRVSPERR